MIVIVGSKGFIGSHLFTFFKERDVDVVGVDIVSDYETESYIKITDASIDFRTLFEKNKNVQICINASGAASVPISFENPHEDFLLNTINVHHLLESIRLFSPQCKFINLSSAAVYGNPASLPIDEKQKSNPISPYGYHKLMAEKLCLEYSQLYGLNTCSTRIFSAYGEGLSKQLFWDLYHKSLMSDHIELYGTGHETRDFIHVKDICEACYLLVHSAPFDGSVFNIANGLETTIHEAVTVFFKQLNWSGSFSFNGIQREGDPSKWLADIRKLNNFGFKPQINLERGLKTYCRWLKEKN